MQIVDKNSIKFHLLEWKETYIHDVINEKEDRSTDSYITRKYKKIN